MPPSLESCELVGEVYDRHLAVNFSGYETLAQLAEAWPDGHYVWLTHERLEPLVNAFERLWLIERMFRIESLPLRGRDRAFVSRAEWLRLTHELLLVRLAGIRDLAALLVSVVYELEIRPRDVSIPRLLKHSTVKGHHLLTELLTKLGQAAPDLREERNRLVHEGVRRAFGDYQLFDTVSHMEALGSTMTVAPIPTESGTVREFNLIDEHQTLARDLEREFQDSRSALHEIVTELLGVLAPEWKRRFEAKRSGRDRAAP